MLFVSLARAIKLQVGGKGGGQAEAKPQIKKEKACSDFPATSVLYKAKEFWIKD